MVWPLGVVRPPVRLDMSAREQEANLRLEVASQRTILIADKGVQAVLREPDLLRPRQRQAPPRLWAMHQGIEDIAAHALGLGRSTVAFLSCSSF